VGLVRRRWPELGSAPFAVKVCAAVILEMWQELVTDGQLLLELPLVRSRSEW